ncbi:MAG: PCRF domain-containing protein, partial [Phycisphaerales bacterium]|nr:PCRF domain-containing protein [Phycisphaerales bacterium]
MGTLRMAESIESAGASDPAIPEALARKLSELSHEYAILEQRLSDPETLADHRLVRELSIKRAAMQGPVEDFALARRLSAEIVELTRVVQSKDDREMAELARAELPAVRRARDEAVERIRSALVNAEDRAVGSVILEVRAGTGGDEASLWARDLLDVYAKYAAKKGWTFEMLELSAEPAVGGVRAAMVNVRGEGVWQELSFEAGVHSVKRVPATEAQGRIHTSTATVATLPEPEQVDVKIDWAKDVFEDVTTSQGPGGQNVNKVATAIKLVHKPTGIEVKMQESKSQQQNREKARRLLMARVYEL